MSIKKGTIKTKSGDTLYPRTSSDIVEGLATVATTGSYSDLQDKLTSETAASGGTTLSLVTTGEKYTWNNMLPLSGGTITGPIKSAYGLSIISDANNNPVLGTEVSTGEVGLGNTTHGARITTAANSPILHQYGSSSPYDVLDTYNTTANDIISGLEPSLTSLKLDGTLYKVDQPTTVVANSGTTTATLEKLQVGSTNYAIPQGTSVVANPTLAGNENALTGLEVGSTKYSLPYLPLGGGTMKGSLVLPTGVSITNSDNYNILGQSGQNINVGNSQKILNLVSNNNDITHTKSGTAYTMLDASNTSANPTLSGGETTLTSLKLNGTNYAIVSGMTNPMTTAGDLILGGSSGTPARLGIGSNGQVLTSNGTTASWQNPTGGVTSFGGATGAITLGSGLSMVGNQLTISIPSYDGTVIDANNAGYSGNITAQTTGTGNKATQIKFGSAPTSASDYDSSVNSSGYIAGDTTYSNETKVYVWGNGGVIINGVTTSVNTGVTYDNAVEVTLTGDYNIVLLYCDGGNVN